MSLLPKRLARLMLGLTATSRNGTSICSLQPPAECNGHGVLDATGCDCSCNIGYATDFSVTNTGSAGTACSQYRSTLQCTSAHTGRASGPARPRQSVTSSRMVSGASNTCDEKQIQHTPPSSYRLCVSLC